MYKRQLWHDAGKEPRYSEYLELDLSTVVPSIAGPKRPQDRVSLTDAKQSFRTALTDYVEPGAVKPHDGYDDAAAESFPASDVPSYSGHGDDDTAPPRDDGDGSRRDTGRPSTRVPVTLADGPSFELDHGAVAIAAITSCTNTSNPSVMIGAALLAKNAPAKTVVVDLVKRPKTSEFYEYLRSEAVATFDA